MPQFSRSSVDALDQASALDHGCADALVLEEQHHVVDADRRTLAVLGDE